MTRIPPFFSFPLFPMCGASTFPGKKNSFCSTIGFVGMFLIFRSSTLVHGDEEGGQPMNRRGLGTCFCRNVLHKTFRRPVGRSVVRGPPVEAHTLRTAVSPDSIFSSASYSRLSKVGSEEVVLYHRNAWKFGTTAVCLYLALKRESTRAPSIDLGPHPQLTGR